LSALDILSYILPTSTRT